MASAPLIREMTPEERPRERLQKEGASALKSSELIAILLRTGMKGVSAVEIGGQLLRAFGSLEALSRASVAEISRIKGVGPTKAVQLAAAFALGARLARSMAEERSLDTAAAVYDLLGEEMRLLDHEQVKVISLNTKLRLIAVDDVTRGTLNESLFHPRETFRPALTRQAYGIILVHNHPSGDPTPSKDDLRVTRQLAQAGGLLQIAVHDHIILGAPGTDREAPWYSFKEHGIL